MAQSTQDDAPALSHGTDRDDGKLISESIPLDAVSVELQQKKPPPESTEEIRTRIKVVASFWATILLLGLPIWWYTTMVYRASLPLTQMNDWADGRVSGALFAMKGWANDVQTCRPVFPLRISIEAGALQELEAQNLLRNTQHALDDLNDFSAHHLRLQLSPPANATIDPVGFSNGPTTGDEEVALLIRLIPGQSTAAILQPYEPTLDIYYTQNQIPTSSSAAPSLATYIAKKLREVFEEEQQMIAYLLARSSAPPERSPKAFSPEVEDALAKRSTRSLKYARTYHLTFSLFTPTSSPSSWKIEAALEEYMKPLLESFSSLCNFTIDTQVQLYATPGVSGQILKKEDLSGFINAAEWPLSPSIGGAPTINFILYVGDMEVEGGGKSWLIPQWGGVAIQSDV
jgi:phosphatidylinositol glycan class S